MAIEGGVFTNLNKRNGYSFPPFMSQLSKVNGSILNSRIANPHNDET